MRVVITGGAGFLGRRVAEAILARGSVRAPGDPDDQVQPVTEIVLADQAVGPQRPLADPRVAYRAGDIRDPDFLKSLIDEATGLIFHLAAVVSGGAEADFELGYAVNVQGSTGVLERCRSLATTPRMVFASSVAAYGGDVPAVITDQTILTPQSSYGTQKAVVELLVNDYSRKGYVDGRCVRLPTVVVRPGRPNLAASSFVSGIIREPLQGEATECPVPEDTALWVLSPRRATAGLMRAAELSQARFAPGRSVALPGLTVTVREMLDALAQVAGTTVAERVKMVPDPFIADIVRSWPSRFAPERGLALGFEPDESAAAIIEAFIEDDLAQC